MSECLAWILNDIFCVVIHGYVHVYLRTCVSIYLFICTHTHTLVYIYTCLYALWRCIHILLYVYACINIYPYLNTLFAFMQCLRSCINTSLRSCIHTHISTCLHTYMRTYLHTYLLICIYTNMLTYKHYIRTLHTSAHVFKHVHYSCRPWIWWKWEVMRTVDTSIYVCASHRLSVSIYPYAYI